MHTDKHYLWHLAGAQEFIISIGAGEQAYRGGSGSAYGRGGGLYTRGDGCGWAGKYHNVTYG